MSRAAALIAVRTWIVAELGGTGGTIKDCVPASSGKVTDPRPVLPYITYEVASDGQQSVTPHEETRAKTHPLTGYETLRWQRRHAVLQLVYYGSAGEAAFDKLRSSLRRRVEKASPASTLRAAGVLAGPAGDILDTTTMRSTAYEAACSQLWDLYYVTTDKNDIGIIETINTPINEPPPPGP